MGVQAQVGDRRWLKRFGRVGPSEIRLLCFHHAGGSASMYRMWPRLLPWFIEPVAVQLPGRADRYDEPPFETMGPLVDELVEVVKPLLDQPFACYGASMGARVAWALTHALRERGMPLPRVLYVASNTAPKDDDGGKQWDVPEDRLVAYLHDMGGTPPEILADPELLADLLPTLRADLAVLRTHRFRPATPLDVRIRAFAGTEDPTAPPDTMTGWRDETRARFDLDPVPGGHFFDADGERQVIRTIANDLT
ncbi:MAG TPA: thioesterase domain-containing protein [Micromonosporaceae bacterium]